MLPTQLNLAKVLHCRDACAAVSGILAGLADVPRLLAASALLDTAGFTLGAKATEFAIVLAETDDAGQRSSILAQLTHGCIRVYPGLLFVAGIKLFNRQFPSAIAI